MLCGGQTCTDMELFGHAKGELLQSFLDVENGIPSHDTLLRWLLADAMHCQCQIAQQVIEQDGDYAQARKGNQGSLRDDVQLFLEDPAPPLAPATQVNKGHGRIETRIASISDDV